MAIILLKIWSSFKSPKSRKMPTRALEVQHSIYLIRQQANPRDLFLPLITS